MKKLLAVILTVVLLVSISPMAYGLSASELIGSILGGDKIDYPVTVDVNVDSDMDVKLTGSTEFVTGPLVTTKGSSDPFPVYTFRDTLYMKVVRDTFKNFYNAGIDITTGKPIKEKELEEMRVSGEFTITATWPTELIAPDAFLEDNKDLNGFSDNVRNIFREKSRTVTDNGDGTKTLTVVVEVAGPEPERPGYVLGKALNDNLENYLPDFTFTCDGVANTDYEQHTVKGTIDGFTYIYEDDAATFTNIADVDLHRYTVNYHGTQLDNGDIGVATNDMAATVDVKRPGGGGGSGGSSGIVIRPTPTPKPGDDDINLSFDLGGLGDSIGDIIIPSDGSHIVDIGDVPTPHEDGYDFDGWYYDPAFTKPATGEITVDEDTTLYAKWVNRTIPGQFHNDPEHHFAYIIGYPEGDVRPENNITRDEIATIFYRLLDAEYRDTIFTSDNNYPDVEKSWWANKAISSISKGGYMEGYEDGTFRATMPITRAEFATVASRFYEAPNTTRKPFSDVSGHWAEDYINAVATLGLVNGYEDGTFRPDAYISRAEAMTIFNRILDRHLNKEGLHKDAVQWPDNSVDAWYYYEVEEATNFHDFKRFSNSYYEDWTAITTNQIWIDKPKYEDPDQ